MSVMEEQKCQHSSLLVRADWPANARHINSYRKKCRLKDKEKQIPLCSHRTASSLRTGVRCWICSFLKQKGSSLSDADFRASGYSTRDEHICIYCFLSLMNVFTSVCLQACLWVYENMSFVLLPQYGLSFPSCVRELELMPLIQSLVPVRSMLLIWLNR